MRCYVDASAAIKLVVAERETPALQAWLDDVDPTVFSSVLLETEVRRAAAANGASQTAATVALAGVHLTAAPRALFSEAAFLPVPGLRSLDALHLATALREEADILVAYDRRLLEGAAVVGLLATSPD